MTDKREQIEWSTKLFLAQHDLQISEARADSWRALASGYSDIRGWLRLCEDTPEGHAEFYRECSEIIFPKFEGTMCRSCSGDGYDVDDDDHQRPCPECNGSGSSDGS